MGKHEMGAACAAGGVLSRQCFYKNPSISKVYQFYLRWLVLVVGTSSSIVVNTKKVRKFICIYTFLI